MARTQGTFITLWCFFFFFFAAQNQGSGCIVFCFKKNGELTAGTARNTKTREILGVGGSLCRLHARHAGGSVRAPSWEFFRHFLILPGNYLSCCALLERAMMLIYYIRCLSGSEYFTFYLLVCLIRRLLTDVSVKIQDENRPDCSKNENKTCNVTIC